MKDILRMIIKEPLRVSASSLKLLSDCSTAFYYSRILKLPEKQWDRTIVGSLCHSLFECFRNPRHRKHYELVVLKDSVDYKKSGAVARLVKNWQQKHNLSEELLLDLNGMLYVGLVSVDFFWSNADINKETGKPLIFGPEYAFNFKIKEKAEIKGFIDDMAVVDGVMVIRDYKSYRNKQTKKELANSIQALIYQLFVWRHFKLPARVEFVALRHPPTPRYPNRHLEIVPPASEAVLMGLEDYLEHIYERINNFKEADITLSPHKDRFFCQKVCSHYQPHPYWVILDGEKAVFSHLNEKDARAFLKNKPTLKIEKRDHAGCVVAWRSEES